MKIPFLEPKKTTNTSSSGLVSQADDATKGLLQFKSNISPDTHFSMAGSEQDQIKVFYDGEAGWLACPDSGAGFYIYSAKVQPNPTNKANCIAFEIKPVAATPEKVCTFN